MAQLQSEPEFSAVAVIIHYSIKGAIRPSVELTPVMDEDCVHALINTLIRLQPEITAWLFFTFTDGGGGIH